MEVKSETVSCFSHVQLFVTLRACSPLGSSAPGNLQVKYWSVLLFTSPEDLPNPGNQPGCPTLQVGSLPSEPPGKPHKNNRSFKNVYPFP